MCSVCKVTNSGWGKSLIAHAHFEKNLHSVRLRGRLKWYIPCTVTKTMVCNMCGKALPTRVKFATRALVKVKSDWFTTNFNPELLPERLRNATNSIKLTFNTFVNLAGRVWIFKLFFTNRFLVFERLVSTFFFYLIYSTGGGGSINARPFAGHG